MSLNIDIEKLCSSFDPEIALIPIGPNDSSEVIAQIILVNQQIKELKQCRSAEQLLSSLSALLHSLDIQLQTEANLVSKQCAKRLKPRLMNSSQKLQQFLISLGEIVGR